MARWRLTEKHYLNVPGTHWQHEETSRETGKKVRKLFDVPVFLNPDDSADCNYPGEIIVADKESRQFPKDIIFVGPPTPGMEPLDDEAESISNQYRERWLHPIESLPSTMSMVEQSRPPASAEQQSAGGLRR